MEVSLHQQTILLETARLVIRETLRGSAPPPLQATTDILLCSRAGCFVSLHERQTHRLRGCVGRLQSPDPLLKNIYESAVSVLGDQRFRTNPVTLQELTILDLELSILSPLQPAANPLDFDPLIHGIYLMFQGRAGTFLPQVARQTGWTREQLLARLCSEKMGLPATSWQDPQAKLLTYEAAIIGPVPFVEQPVATGGFGQGNVFRV
jgi:AmmeMemoRadiSam system protein A